jgi:hypothetical protein
MGEPFMTTPARTQPATFTGVRFFGGLVSGLSAAMITSSLLYLLWFIPLGRPGSHIQTVDEIVMSLKAGGDARPVEELRPVAEGVQTRQQWVARIFYTPLEIIILTSTCLVAACFASLFGRAYDRGDGRGEGTLLLPTMIGTAAGAVVLWLLFSVLVAKPAAAHPTHAPAHPETPHTPPDVAASHGSQAPASPPRAEAAHDEHAPKDWSAWLAENSNVAELVAYMLGTLIAAAVGVLAPRGTARTTPSTTSTDGQTLAPAH